MLVGDNLSVSIIKTALIDYLNLLLKDKRTAAGVHSMIFLYILAISILLYLLCL